MIFLEEILLREHTESFFFIFLNKSTQHGADVFSSSGRDSEALSELHLKAALIRSGSLETFLSLVANLLSASDSHSPQTPAVCTRTRLKMVTIR